MRSSGHLDTGRTIALILGGLLVFLGSISCSLRNLAVNNFQWLSTRTATSYFDLEPAQKKQFQSQLKIFFVTSKETHFKKFFAAIAEIPDSIDPVAALNEGNAALREVAGQACDSFAPIMASLSDNQIEHFRAKLAETNEDHDPEENGGWQNLRSKQQSRQLKMLRRWLGDLEVGQVENLARYAAEKTDWNDADGLRERQYLAYRIESQNVFLKLLDRHRGDPDGLARECRAFTDKPDQFLSEESRIFNEKRRNIRNETVKQIAPTLTTQQRNHIKKEIETIKTDVEKITADFAS